MAILGSAAYQLDLYTEEQHASGRYALSVMEGGGRDARTRAGAMPLSMSLAYLVVGFVFLFALLGGVRVTLSALTVQCLSDVSAANSTVSSARMERTQLQADRSQLLAADRIQRIATQNLGMSFGTTAEHITVTLEDEYQSEASADDTQLAHDAEVDGSVA